jgi:hypothetical protein
MFADEWDKMLDGMFETDVRALCHLLLLKRSVDGGRGREWDASKHMEYETLIQETLERMGKQEGGER